MVRQIKVEAVDHIARPLIAVGNEYSDGHFIAPHVHRRGQLISSATGSLVVTTPEGRWVTPPHRGMWIPGGAMHDVNMLGAVSMQSLYLEPAMAEGMPERCQVVAITQFVRSLLAQAIDLPADYDPNSRAGALMTLIQHEMRRLRPLALSVPIPANLRLAARCQKFLQAPAIHETIDAWSVALGMSRRSFTRLFRRETGMTFVEWRQQACLISALPRLAAGARVTEISAEFGYDNPAAFTTMFKRALGSSPSAYFKQGGEPWDD